VTLDACFAALGLAGPVARRELHRAYKRMVLRYHPDHCGDDPAAREAYQRATEAYVRLKDLYSQRGVARRYGPCARCHRLDRLLTGLHGQAVCGACMLGLRRRLLPLPIYRTIRGAAVIALQALSVAAAVFGAAMHDVRVAAAGVAAALLSLVALLAAFRSADHVER
jgi:hypothetical protein